MKRLLPLLLIALPATAAVTPSVTCWSDSTGTDLVTIRFGYTNSGAAAVTIPVGSNNLLSVASANPPQPTTFEPGTHSDAFLITVPAAEASSVEWTVDGATAAVNIATDPECTGCFCPAGPQGVDGAQGPVGPAGPPGPAGPAGAEGLAGPQGPQGEAGPAGPEGPIGIDGLQGADGDAGPVGTIGPAGPAGIAGTEPGPKGPVGDIGPAGVRGDAGPRGPRGIEGPPGSVGTVGAAGASGVRGVIGHRGGMGLAGPVGAVGSNGAGSIVRSPRQLFVTGVITARSSSGGKVWVTVAGQAAGIEFMVPPGDSSISIPVSFAANARGDRSVEVHASSGVVIEQSSLSALGLRTPSPRRRAVAR
jgi:hypothetical protein